MEKCPHKTVYIKVLRSVVTVEVVQLTCYDCGASLEPEKTEAS